MKNILLIFSLLAIVWSCSQAERENKTTPEKIPVANASAELEIRGMTCETGCKKTIEKNVRKMAGVTKFDIDFEHTSAHVEFDTTIVNAEEIKEKINSINNGAYMAIVHEVSNL